MLVYVETFFLNALVDTQAMELLDAIEQGNTTGSSPEVDYKDTKAFGSEEPPTMTIEGTTAGRKQSRQQRT